MIEYSKTLRVLSPASVTLCRITFVPPSGRRCTPVVTDDASWARPANSPIMLGHPHTPSSRHARTPNTDHVEQRPLRMYRHLYRLYLRYIQPERIIHRISRTPVWSYGQSIFQKAKGPAFAVFVGYGVANMLIWDQRLPGSLSYWYHYNGRLSGDPNPAGGRVYASTLATQIVRAPRKHAEPQAYMHPRVYVKFVAN